MDGVTGLRVYLLSVGTEVACGLVVDTNAAWLAAHLTELGAQIVGVSVVPDQLDQVSGAFRESFAVADWVIATGGLGPTADDLTREALARALKRRLVKDPDAVAELKAYYARVGRTMPEENVRQADVPEGGELLANHHGTAPGVRVPLASGGQVVLLPGPPREMQAMASEYVLGPLSRHQEHGITRILRVTGIGESQIDEWLADLMNDTDPSLRPYAKEIEVHLRLHARGEREAAAARVGELEREVERRLGPCVYGRDDQTLESVVLTALAKRNATVAVVESLTGGEVIARLTALPGASQFVRGGFTVYGEGAKAQMLGLSPSEVAGPKAVRPVVAAQMAQAATQLLQADYAVSLTGYAGPTADGDEPVGRVYLAVVGPDRRIRSCKTVLGGDRTAVRRRAGQLALDLLRRAIVDLPVPEDGSVQAWISGKTQFIETDPSNVSSRRLSRSDTA